MELHGGFKGLRWVPGMRVSWQIERRSEPRWRGLGGSARSGFSMLELIIAIAVLLIGTLAAFGTQMRSFELIDASRDSAVAVTDLEVCMEQVLTQTAGTIPTAFPPDAPIVAFDELHLPDQRIVPTYPGYVAGGPVPDPLEIVLNSTWSDGRGRPQSMNLITVKSR